MKSGNEAGERIAMAIDAKADRKRWVLSAEAVGLVTGPRSPVYLVLVIEDVEQAREGPISRADAERQLEIFQAGLDCMCNSPDCVRVFGKVMLNDAAGA